MAAVRARPAVGWLTLAAGVVVAFFLLGVGARAVSPSPSGPPLSSYSTTAQGVAAWAELLSRDGHAVRQLRTAVGEGSLPADATLVILASRSDLSSYLAQPDAGRAFTAGIQRLLDRGGRVILGGSAASLARSLRGKVVAVSRPGFLENAALASGENAYRALQLAGSPSRPVYFDEVLHGYGSATGLAALPERWWFALGAFGLALLAWALSRAARLGGPDPLPEPTPSPRTAYIEAMAQTLERAAKPDELKRRLKDAREPGATSESPVKISAR